MTNTKDTHHLRQIGSNDKTIPFCVVMFDAYNILMYGNGNYISTFKICQIKESAIKDLNELD